MDTVAVGPAQLVYQRRGRSTGEPPLLLLHGYVGSSADWAGVGPALAERREVITYDHRGHGDSTNFGDERAYTFDRLVDDLRGFLDALGVDRVDLLGHSMGGVVAQIFTLSNPQRVRSLVLMDTSPLPNSGLGGLALGAAGVAAGRWGMAPLVGLADKFIPAAPDEAGRARQVVQRRAMTKMDPAAFRGFGRELRIYPSLVGRLGAITCPTLVMVGERDRGLHRGSLALARGIPGARLVVIRGAMHSPQTEQPQAWLDAVETHLVGVGAA